MKLKNLILIGMCAIAATAFAAEPFLPEGGTLLFHEDFNSGATADANTGDTYKVGSSFYVVPPPAGTIEGDRFNPARLDGPDVNIRWDYPNNSGEQVWAPRGGSSHFLEIELNTSAFEYAYLSLASLFWGGYAAYYSFDEWETEYQFSPHLLYRSFAVTYIFEDCGWAGARGIPYPEISNCACGEGWWYDQYTENLGGHNVVSIRIECTGGAPLQIDDIQVTGYAKEVVNKIPLEERIEQAIEFLEENDGDPKYCPLTLSLLSILIEGAQSIDPEFTQEDINEFLLFFSEILASASTRDVVADDIIEAFEEVLYAANQLKEKMAGLPPIDEEEEEIMQVFETILELANSVNGDYCGEVAMRELTDELAYLIFHFTYYISVEEAKSPASAYPNPANDYVRIANVEGVTVYIFNAAGQQVLSVSDYNGGDIPVSNLTAGVYTAVYGKQAVLFIKK